MFNLNEGTTLMDLQLGTDASFANGTGTWRLIKASSDEGSSPNSGRREKSPARDPFSPRILHKDAQQTNGFYKRKQLIMSNKAKYLKSL